MKKLIPLVVAAACLWPQQASAEGFYTGAVVYDKCMADKGSKFYSQRSAGCMDYISGVFDTLILNYGAGRGESFCPPGQLTLGQVVDMVRRHMAAHPESRQLDAASVVATPLLAAFKCTR
ncbi:MAG TPA: Rap1a/Tai family immunity protein [Sphingomicrobium sp.]|nr:Rap1a/Tai family immunity protein [Sphingomicrobium sp.]